MVDYVSKWVEAMPCRKASTKESISMIKSMIFPHFGTPRILISDGGTHFTGKNFKKCLSKLGIEHRVSTAYHPQTNEQAETLNRQLKSILNKTIEKGGKDWLKKLDGALWAYRTAFKCNTLILLKTWLYQNLLALTASPPLTGGPRLSSLPRRPRPGCRRAAESGSVTPPPPRGPHAKDCARAI
jgi:transposase InsO family protein